MPAPELAPLRAAIDALDSALAVADDNVWLSRQSESVRRVVAAGVVQSFEFTYELAVRMIARGLAFGAASSAAAALLNFRDLMRRAGEAGLVDDVSAWFDYREQRNITAHTYNCAKADAVAQAAVSFARDVRRLLERLEARDG